MTGIRSPRALVVLAALALAVALVPAAAGAAPSQRGCEARTNDTYNKLLQCVTVDGVREHQAAFQAIADANGGTRASGTPGYDASADYVAGLMEDAGYVVTRQSFEFPFFSVDADPVLQIVEPGPVTDVPSDVATYSGSGDVTGAPTPIDLDLGPGNASTSGCEPEDFAGTDTSGDADIAITQRGACNFSQKALNAQDAGFEAVVIFNQGNTEDRSGPLLATLGPENAGLVDIPVLGTSTADGLRLLDADTIRVAATTTSAIRTTENVIAETPWGDPDNVVMAGAHLDSVPEGPGINDNGSGSGALLEVALQMADVETPNKVRYAWWGAEEFGLIGSTEYVASLSEDALADIALYLNYDMVGSPNYILSVYDADESTFPAPDGVTIPDGSTAIEDVFESWYTQQGLPYEDSEYSGRSDYQAFIDNGIPSGGLFTGAEVVKSEEQQAIWGGVAGEQFDQCYHQACDTFDNTSLEALDVNSDLIAYAQLHFAFSTEAVNGVPGQDVPGRPLPAPGGPEGTFGTSDGGLAPHDHAHADAV